MCRFHVVDLTEHLRVGDDERWRLFEIVETLLHVGGGAAQGYALLVEQVAQSLHLWQYESALGGLRVLRHDEQNGVASFGKRTCEAELLIAATSLDQGLLQAFDALRVGGADRNRSETECPTHLVDGLEQIADEVDLVQHQHHRHIELLQSVEPLALECEVLRLVKDQQGHVGLVEHLAGAFVAQFTHIALIVITGRVDKQARSQRVDFHGAVHGVGGGASLGRDDGHLLTCDSIEQ